MDTRAPKNLENTFIKNKKGEEVRLKLNEKVDFNDTGMPHLSVGEIINTNSKNYCLDEAGEGPYFVKNIIEYHSKDIFLELKGEKEYTIEINKKYLYKVTK